MLCLCGRIRVRNFVAMPLPVGGTTVFDTTVMEVSTPVQFYLEPAVAQVPWYGTCTRRELDIPITVYQQQDCDDDVVPLNLAHREIQHK